MYACTLHSSAFLCSTEGTGEGSSYSLRTRCMTFCSSVPPRFWYYLSVGVERMVLSDSAVRVVVQEHQRAAQGAAGRIQFRSVIQEAGSVLKLRAIVPLLSTPTANATFPCAKQTFCSTGLLCKQGSSIATAKKLVCPIRDCC